MSLFQINKQKMQNDYDTLFQSFCDYEPDIKQKIDKAYEECQVYLDSNFKDEFPRKGKFISRLWELWICNQILNSDYSNKLARASENNPDCILKNIINETDLSIECVAAGVGNHPFQGGDYQYNEEKIVSISSGIDSFIVSRFTNSLTDKSKKVSRYKSKNNGLFVLAVCGLELARYKAEQYSQRKQMLSVETEFETAINGECNYYFSKGCRPEKSSIEKGFDREHKPHKFNKPNGSSVVAGFQRYLSVFDVIIFSEKIPFNCSSRRWHNLYYGNKEKEKRMEDCLERIFK